jgi:hypothetical protein
VVLVVVVKVLCKQNIKQDQIEIEQHYKHNYKLKDLVKHKLQDKQIYKTKWHYRKVN